MFKKRSVVRPWLDRQYECRGVQNFQESTIHLKNLGARKMTRGHFHTKGPQILGATAKKKSKLPCHAGSWGLCTPVNIIVSDLG